MMERHKGRIISIASIGGVGPNPYSHANPPYGSAKAGVIGFTKHLAKELGPYGITVNSVSPSTTLSARTYRVRDAETLRRLAERNPMGHLVEPEDIAEAIVFLASDKSRYITGVNLNVNAGTLIA
jgi:3-oxoacyl-[acyl-carrier protein] reductase